MRAARFQNITAGVVLTVMVCVVFVGLVLVWSRI
jgi:hypothetical protein